MKTANGATGFMRETRPLSPRLRLRATFSTYSAGYTLTLPMRLTAPQKPDVLKALKGQPDQPKSSKRGDKC